MRVSGQVFTVTGFYADDHVDPRRAGGLAVEVQCGSVSVARLELATFRARADIGRVWVVPPLPPEACPVIWGSHGCDLPEDHSDPVHHCGEPGDPNDDDIDAGGCSEIRREGGRWVVRFAELWPAGAAWSEWRPLPFDPRSMFTGSALR